jgi:cytochrome c2
MKLSRKGGLWLGATIALAAIAFGRGQDESVSKGERILNANCISCHDLRKVQTQALDAAGWTKIVNSMVEKGAKVQKDEVPVLVSFLEDNYGPLPDGPGKAIVLEKCTVCHDLSRVREHLATPEEWADTLTAMGNEGLMLDDDEFATVLRYLARNFRN